MGEVIWVEVLGRGGDVAHRHRFSVSEVHIGRGYDNDVILDDPYVDARHLRVFRDANGALAVENLSLTNGMFVGREAKPEARAALGDGLVQIGRTHLRIRDASHAVPPARLLRPRGREWPIAVALLAAILAIEVVSSWLNEVGEFQTTRLIIQLFGVCAVLLVWTAVWSVLTRIFTGHMHFERNLLIAMAGVLTYSVLNEILGVLPFMMSWTAVARYEFAGFWAVLAAMCILHLREIGPSRMRLKGGVVAAIALAGISLQLIGQTETRSIFPSGGYVRLLPPAFRVAAAQDEAAFFGDVARIKAQLDVDRTKSPTDTPGIVSLFDD